MVPPSGVEKRQDSNPLHSVRPVLRPSYALPKSASSVRNILSARPGGLPTCAIRGRCGGPCVCTCPHRGTAHGMSHTVCNRPTQTDGAEAARTRSIDRAFLREMSAAHRCALRVAYFVYLRCPACGWIIAVPKPAAEGA